MANLRWDGDDFRNSQDSSGSTADLVSHSGKLQQGYKHGSLTDGLVAYYPMEKGEGDVIHDGALNNLGRIVGASWTTGNIGSHALDFNDSNNEYVDTGSPLTGNHPFTVSAWIKPDVVGVDFKEIAANHTPNDDGWYFRNDSSGWKFSIRDSSGSDLVVTSGTNSTADIWTHLTGVWDGEKIKLYVNGGKEDSISATSHTPSNSNVYIGASPGYGEYFDGTIEDVRIYDRALSKPEIKALYNLAQTSGIQITEKKVPNQKEDGVSRYKFNGDVTDSWSSNDGTDNTSAGYSTGVYGSAKSFDGTDDYINIPDDSSLDFINDFTTTAWINLDTINNDYQRIIHKQSNFTFSVDQQNSRLGTYNYDQNYWIRSNDNVLNDNEWVFVALVWSSSKGKKFYVNGSYAGGDTTDITDTATSQEDIQIGLDDDLSSYALKGQIDDVRIYNTALTPQQIEKLYHKGAYRIPRRSTLQ
jgi:hypothetical protein